MERYSEIWFTSFLNHISNERWENNFPHAQDINETPIYFKECIIDFRNYFAKHGNDNNQIISSKVIYRNLIRDKNHRPITLSRFPGLDVKPYFEALHSRGIFSPELKDFLYKLYHGRLFFKKYASTMDDLLHPNRYPCILCGSGIDTPDHLFSYCIKGLPLRQKRNSIIDKYQISNSLTQDNLIGCFSSDNNCKINTILLLIAMSNYTIYKYKMKKFYNIEETVTSDNLTQTFRNFLKNRIICDIMIHCREEFVELWDPGGQRSICDFVDKKIISWYF